MTTPHIVFWGSGNMARALAQGWRKTHATWRFSFWSPSGTSALLSAKQTGGAVLQSPTMPDDVTGVVLGFKPQSFELAASQLAPLLPRGIPCFSLLAAVDLQRLSSLLPLRPLVRLMPNLSIAEQQGVVLWTASEKGPWQSQLSCLGLAEEVPEKLLDVYTAHAGCSPAFLYQWLKDAGEFAREHGGDADLAVRLLHQAFKGTLLNPPPAYVELETKISTVASKGGVTRAILDEWLKIAPNYIKQGFAAGLARIRSLKG